MHTTLAMPTTRRAGGRTLALVIGVLLVALALVGFWPTHAPQGRLTFDPAALAYAETEGWRAYYDRAWLRALGLMLQLNHDAFGLTWFDTLRASYYATRAQIAFAGADNNPPLAQDYLAKYYAVVAQGRGLAYDPARAAEAEMRYWIVHRQVAQNPADPAPLVNALADLHRTLFDISPDAAHASAVERTAAAQAVDRITGRRSTDVAADWRAVYDHLLAAYVTITQAMPPA